MNVIGRIPHPRFESDHDMLRKPTKSEQTLAAIVNAAKEIAFRHGLLNLSLNAVASELDISKSGVFVRAGSLENLQILVLESYEKGFEELVFRPAMEQPRGLPRLNALIERWIECSPGMKALIISHYSATAYDDDNSSVSALKTRLTQGMTQWREVLEHHVSQAVAEGHLRPDTDPGQLVFELFGLMSAFMYDTHRRQDPLSQGRIHRAYARLMSTYVSFEQLPTARAARPAAPHKAAASSASNDAMHEPDTTPATPAARSTARPRA